MKLICFLCMAALQVSLFASDSNNSPSIKPVQTNKNTGSQIEFEFSVEEKGDYYISLAMYGNFDEKYTVQIDGQKKGFLCLNKDGLQNAYYQKTLEGLDDKLVRLKKGSHTITVLGNNEWEIPNVLEIKVAKNYGEIMFSIPKLSVQNSELIQSTPMNSATMSTTDYCPDCYVQDRGYSYYDYSYSTGFPLYRHTYKRNYTLTAYY